MAVTIQGVTYEHLTLRERKKPMAAAVINAGEVCKNVTMTVRVTGMRKWRFRLWLGMQLLRLTAWVFPVNVLIVEGMEDGN